MSTDENQRLVEAFRSLGLSESQARIAACGRDPGKGSSGDAFEDQVLVFQRLGLSEAEARRAAIGRAGSEREARGSGGHGPAAKSGLERGRELLREVEAGDRALAVLSEAQRRRGR